jgi:hypothetical protein
MKRLILSVILGAILGQTGVAYQFPTTIKKGASIKLNTVYNYVAGDNVPGTGGTTETTTSGGVVRAYITPNFENTNRLFYAMPISNRWILVQHIDADMIRARIVSDNRDYLLELEATCTPQLSLGSDQTTYFLYQPFSGLCAYYRKILYPTLVNNYSSQEYYDVLVNGVTVNKLRKTMMPLACGVWEYSFLTITYNLGKIGQHDLCFNRYIEFDPINYGSTINIKTLDGLSFTLNTGIDATPVIKVNQLGYIPDSTKKYAFLGWGMPFASWNITTFDVVDDVTTFDLCLVSDNSVAYTGTITYPINDEKFSDYNAIPGNLLTSWVSGEKTRKMDFSSVTTSGQYYIKIPTVGRSYPFAISYDAYEKANYHVPRRLHNQRCSVIPSTDSYWPNATCNHVINYVSPLHPYIIKRCIQILLMEFS